MEDNNLEDKLKEEEKVRNDYQKMQWRVIADMMSVFAIELHILYATTGYFQSIFPGEVKAELYAGETTLLLCLPLAYLAARFVTRK